MCKNSNIMEVESMDGKKICEVLLKSYKDLETLAEICDTKMLSWALKQNTNIFKTIEYMNNIYIEKIAYCNLKVIIDEAILRIGHCEELKYVYFQGVKYNELENIIEMTTYTLNGKVFEYRNKTNAFINRVRTQRKNFYNYLTRRYDFEKIFNIMKDSKTLMHRYNTILAYKKQINNFGKVYKLKEQQ